MELGDVGEMGFWEFGEMRENLLFSKRFLL